MCGVCDWPLVLSRVGEEMLVAPWGLSLGGKAPMLPQAADGHPPFLFLARHPSPPARQPAGAICPAAPGFRRLFAKLSQEREIPAPCLHPPPFSPPLESRAGVKIVKSCCGYGRSHPKLSPKLVSTSKRARAPQSTAGTAGLTPGHPRGIPLNQAQAASDPLTRSRW